MIGNACNLRSDYGETMTSYKQIAIVLSGEVLFHYFNIMHCLATAAMKCCTEYLISNLISTSKSYSAAHDITFKHRAGAAAGRIFWTYLGRGPATGQNRGPAVPVRCHAVLGRTHMCQLAYWRTGLLVLVQGSWYYVYVSYATNAGTNGPQPRQKSWGLAVAGRGIKNGPQPAEIAAGLRCGPDVMHC